MPGRNDWSAGFTKSAQKNKFVRKRDVKMKDSEIKKDAHISKAMCEGICRHCIEKLQWKFKYDKYKPLKNVGNCKSCKQKVITKAYRSFCDKCASAKHVCPSCLVNFDEANKPIPETTKTAIKAAKANNAGKKSGASDEHESMEDDEDEGSDEEGGEGEEGEEGMDGEEEEGDMGENPDEEAEDMDDDEA